MGEGLAACSGGFEHPAPNNRQAIDRVRMNLFMLVLLAYGFGEVAGDEAGGALRTESGFGSAAWTAVI